jgi:hypothetical protein
MRRLQGLGTFCDDLLLPGSELLMKRQEEFKESLGEILMRIQLRRGLIHRLRGGVFNVRCHMIKSTSRGTDPNAGIRSADVVKGVIDGALLGPALMLLEVGLQLGFGLIGINYKFLPGSKCQFANIAIRSVRSAPDESDNSEPSVRHGDIMAGRARRVKFLRASRE